MMIEASLFMLGFSAVTAIYEIAKTSKSTHSNKIVRETNKLKNK